MAWACFGLNWNRFDEPRVERAMVGSSISLGTRSFWILDDCNINKEEKRLKGERLTRPKPFNREPLESELIFYPPASIAMKRYAG